MKVNNNNIEGYFNVIDISKPTHEYYRYYSDTGTICNQQLNVLVDSDSLELPNVDFVNNSLEAFGKCEKYEYYHLSRKLWAITLRYGIGVFPESLVNISLPIDGSYYIFTAPSFNCVDPASLTYQITPLEYSLDRISAVFEIIPSHNFYLYDSPSCSAPFPGILCGASLPRPYGIVIVMSIALTKSITTLTTPFNLTITTNVGHLVQVPVIPRYTVGPVDMSFLSNSQSPPRGYTMPVSDGYYYPSSATFDIVFSDPSQVNIITSTSSGYIMYPLIPVLGNQKDGLKFIDSPISNGFSSSQRSYLLANASQAINFTYICNSSLLIQQSPLPNKPEFLVYEFNDTMSIYSMTFTISQISYPLRFRYQLEEIRNTKFEYRIPAPFGYTVTQAIQQFTIPMNDIKHKDIVSFIFQQDSEGSDSSRYNLSNIIIQSDYIQPIIYNISYKKVSPQSYLVTLNLYDEDSGIEWISFKDQLFGSNTLVDGTIHNGTFVFETFELIPESDLTAAQYFQYRDLYVADGAWNTFGDEFKVYNVYDDKIHLFPKNPFSNKFVTAENFTRFEFIPNIIDTTNGEVNVSLVFNLTTDGLLDKNNNLVMSLLLSTWSPFYIMSWGQLNITSTSYFHPIDQLFRIDFTVPQYTNNITASYGFTHLLLSPIQTSLVEKFGLKASLEINSNNSMDHLPPYFESIIIPTSPTNGLIEYEFTIIDLVNGFENGSIEIKSSISPIPFVFHFDQSTLVSGGTPYNSTYRFNITIDESTCNSHTLSIGYTKLVDKAGWTSEYKRQRLSQTDPIQKIGYFNPFYYLINQLPTLITTINCNPSFIDLFPPTILSFNVSKKILNVGSNDRYISIDLEITDGAGVGIFNNYTPTVYLWGNQGEWLSVNPSLPTTDSLIFSYDIIVPHGFGVNGILLSVYGLRDKQENLDGYSSTRLCSQGFQCMINTTYSTDIPNISNVTNLYSYPNYVPVSSDDEVITIRGRGFGDDPSKLIATLVYQDGEQQHTILWVHHIIAFIQYNPRRAVPNKPVFVELIRVGQGGNFLSVYPKILPAPIVPPPPPPYIPKPIPCSSSPSASINCTGNGVCTVGDGCRCNNGWSGFFCESTIINVDRPTFNQTSPMVDIIVNNTNSHTVIRSIISVVAIRELTMDDQVFKEYRPKNWILNITTPDINNNNNSIVMNYQTQLLNISTIVNVTIEWFAIASQVEFANQTIQIPATSTKVSIGISSYPFNSYTNTLQVIMKTSVEAEYESKCTSKEYGGDSDKDIEWMKLSIDDKSLFGQFIKRGVIDNDQISTINNEIVTDFIDNDSVQQSNSSFSTTYIGLNIPIFFTSVQLDPNFVHLIDVDNKVGTSIESTCKGSDEKGLSMGKIAGIVVGCIVGAAIGVALTIYLTRRHRERKLDRNTQLKLQRVSQQMSR
ncbi:hypothetical protein DFA_11788 [Cavenderia fasciculata]|uniref:EGF-like domain-containing protein n=1 Tax=Cavenderia fasciculata TaxID=261658 RepID=F4QE79_CACFS|nr:uncharacterized protein DFA_11788 [Cavenderia fasciculata]EGG14026.1 hypothetical protein DFA_11788 [Cavenderia fasciculata]|eukprot:XP_004350734.1 hypothetical protein DFA_11788 [Cavenderia fasciculata]